MRRTFKARHKKIPSSKKKKLCRQIVIKYQHQHIFYLEIMLDVDDDDDDDDDDCLDVHDTGDHPNNDMDFFDYDPSKREKLEVR